MKRTLIVSALLMLGACDLELAAITPAPPGTVASVDDCEQTVELTRGVAVGIDCLDGGLECESMSVDVDDPEIAEAYLSFDSEIDEYEYAYDRYQPRTSLVLVGRSEGKTRLHVGSSGGSVSYDVTVLAP